MAAIPPINFIRATLWHRAIWGISFVLIGTILPSLSAHEGHRPLPTRGMEVDIQTGRMILTRFARETLDVQTVEVATQPVFQTVLAYGTLVSPWNRHALVSSPLGGRIVKLLVAPGDKVSAGRVLAEVESPDVELLQQELRTAQTELELSTKLVRSTESASKSGAIPGMRFLEAKIKFKQDQAALEIAKLKWHALQLPEESLVAILREPRVPHSRSLTLSSPIDGIVTHADLSVGKIIDPKEHLFEVLDLSTVWLKVGMLEKDLSHMREGQSLDLRLSAYPDGIISSKVEVLGQFLDPQTRLGSVWSTLRNPKGLDPRLLPGMSGEVQLHSDKDEVKLVVPVSAIARDGAERFVLVEEEQTQVASTYQKQTVVLGRRVGKMIEVRGGNLVPGDRVVSRGSHELGSFFTKGTLTVSPETARDIGLKVQSASHRSLDETITVDGIVDVPPTSRTVASAQMGGTIHRILVDRSQRVRSGDVLAELVSPDFQSLQLELIQSQLNSDLQQSVIDSLQVASDGVSQRRVWEAENQLNQMQSRRDTLQKRLKTAGVSDEQIADLLKTKKLVPTLPVRASIDGVVVEFDKFLGHAVRPDEPLFEIHDLSQTWVQGFVSERDLPRVHVGQSVRVRLVADPDEVFVGRLVRSGRSVGRSDRTLSVWIEFAKMPRIQVQHNMSARVTIEAGQTEPALVVPLTAIVREGTRSYVFVQRSDGIFERRFVETGRSDDQAIEIRKGLQLNESVAVGGTAALQTGYAALK